MVIIMGVMMTNLSLKLTPSGNDFEALRLQFELVLLTKDGKP